MPDEKELQSGRHLAKDLRRLREEHDVSIHTLNDETKIPMGLIESFEEDALFGHAMFNRVYLRSFVRTYAQVVGLDVDRVSQALEAALRGEYAGELSEGPSEAQAEPSEAVEGGGEASMEGETAGIVAGAPEVTESEEPEEGSARSHHERPERPTEREERQPEQDEEVAASGAAAGAVTSPPRAKPRDTAGRSDRRRSRSSGSRGGTWIYVAGGAVVLALLVWLAVSLLGGGGEPETAQQPAAAEAAAASAQPDTAQREPEFEPVAIGDSIDVEVVAADGPIRELRIRRDEETRRPHWIEEGQSESFRAVNRITFSPPIEATQERPMDMMRLLVEGREYPTSQRNEEGQIVITRERAQTVLDSLARARQGP